MDSETQAHFRYVYILESLQVTGAHYTGLTDDLRKRLAKHNSGVVPHTRTPEASASLGQVVLRKWQGLFLLSSRRSQGGKRPLDLLRAGDVETVLQLLAAGYGS